MNSDSDHDTDVAAVEEHPWFPSGNWVGWFIQGEKFPMEVRMTFRNGTVTAEGIDAQIGEFLYRGRYSTSDGRCYWTKSYLTSPYSSYSIFYTGYNEGKGIWGLWEIPSGWGYSGDRGRFFLRPEGWPDPWSDDLLKESLDLPEGTLVTEAEEFADALEPALSP